MFRTVCIVLVCLSAGTGCSTGSWPQWGGPNRNFKVECEKLAATWPADGPKVLWSRDLGDGYSSICAVGGRLYTMYRKDDQEYVVALEAKTGKTVWEHGYPVETTRMMDQFGGGPRSTPLIVAGRVFTVGINAVMYAFEADSGKVLWKHDLATEYGGTIPGRGYSASAIAYKNTVIVPVGGAGQSLVAFDQKDGSIIWKNNDFQITHASPIVINLEGEDQLVAFMAAEIVGLDPASGKLKWFHPHPTQFGANISTPSWNGKDLLFISSAYGGGSRVIRLIHRKGKTMVGEVWSDKKIQIHHGNAVWVGDYVYCSSGSFGPAFLTAVNAETGEIAWRERGFAKATGVYGDGKLILLDQDGKLALAAVTPKGLTVLAEVEEFLKRTAWTVPTLVGRTLYVRDRERIVALDLG
jgi:outer membrane protein assembly factor BamB